MLSSLPPLSARISVAAMRRNIRALRSRLPHDVALSAVVKSDGYGHGMEAISRVADEEGSAFLIVATLEEALRLKSLRLRSDILIVGALFAEEVADAVAHDICVCVGSLEIARALSQAAQAQGKKARVHLKLDTGMGRFGFLVAPESLAPALDSLLALPGLSVEGVLTHFSEADDPSSDFTSAQIARFQDAVREIRGRGVPLRWIHAANSGAVAFHPNAAFTMARVGLSLYGVYPGDAPVDGLSLEPVMSLVTRVADLRDVPANTPVSYGRTFVTSRPTRLALLPVGYGHGYPRPASGRAQVMIGGRRAPVAGRITMNLTVVDVTDLPGVAVGDPVLVFGRLGEDELPVAELARAAGMIPYEILCNVGRCAPRVITE